MTSLPLELYEVLEEEYISTNGPLEPLTSGAKYTEADVIDVALSKAVLAGYVIDQAAGIVAVLNSLIVSSDLGTLRSSAVLTESGRAMIELYAEYTDGVTDERRQEINRRIIDSALVGAVRPLSDVRLARIYGLLHARPDSEARTALCLSGGGVRSATFALGVLQGLASVNILDKFEYLSTVSGGSYIGGWLSSWSCRHPNGIRGVQEDLIRADASIDGSEPGGVKADRPKRKVDPEPRPLRHLREYSSYISPKLDLTSNDTWIAVSLYLRNLVLNLFVLVPVLAGVLEFPRLFALLLRHVSGFMPQTLLLIAAIALAVAFTYTGAARPTIHGRQAGLPYARWAIGHGGFLVFCLVPLVVAAAALALYWATVAEYTFANVARRDGLYLLMLAFATTLLPASVYYTRFFVFTTAVERRESLQGQHSLLTKLAVELVAAITGLGVTVWLLSLIAGSVFAHPLRVVSDVVALPPYLRALFSEAPVFELYVCSSVPLVLLVVFVQNALVVGISGQVTEDYDREWWAQAGAFVLVCATAIALNGYISVFGPVLLYRAPLVVASIGGVSGVLAALFGFAKERGKISGVARFVSAPIFMVVFLSAISLARTETIERVRFGSERTNELWKWGEQFKTSTTLTQTSVPSAGGKLEVKYETDKTPYWSSGIVNGLVHLKVVRDTSWPELFAMAILTVGALVLSRFISVNYFSMFSLYRSRLIRTYLGGSRYTRDPDRFTGFDPHDNLQMYAMRPEMIWPGSFTDVAGFIEQLKMGIMRGGSVELEIWNALDRRTRMRLEMNESVDGPLIDALAQNVNETLLTENLDGGFGHESAAARLRHNREMLQETFDDYLLPVRRGPTQVVNATLNLTRGDGLSSRKRQTESFTISPLHSGSPLVGYRDSKRYAGKNGISLGTAITISGADLLNPVLRRLGAPSPIRGFYRSPATSFALAVLNVRLGWWIGNPGLAGRGIFSNSKPRTFLEPLVWEIAGIDDQCSLVHLSDGGHFDNLGIYEMVLRRCRYIVSIDASCDPKFKFEDLGNVMRKVRIDLGIPIDMEAMRMFPRADGALVEGRYVATAKIRYSAIDEKAPDGMLIYIKPSLYADDSLPKDVYNYAQVSPEFPHEQITDEFFSESQFESYRALGRHIVNTICGNYRSTGGQYANKYDSVAAFGAAVNCAGRNTPVETEDGVLTGIVRVARALFGAAS
jgi:hypothetical protein